MNQRDQVFHICQFTAERGNEVVYQIDSQADADDYCELKNAKLSARGIPSDVTCWFTTGPHQNPSRFN